MHYTQATAHIQAFSPLDVLKFVDQGLRLLSFYFPHALTEFDQPLPAGHFRVVVVDGGGITCRSRPIPKFRVGTDGILHIGRS
jgi:hypothetical protein